MIPVIHLEASVRTLGSYRRGSYRSIIRTLCTDIAPVCQIPPWRQLASMPLDCLRGLLIRLEKDIISAGLYSEGAERWVRRMWESPDAFFSFSAMARTMDVDVDEIEGKLVVSYAKAFSALLNFLAARETALVKRRSVPQPVLMSWPRTTARVLSKRRKRRSA